MSDATEETTYVEIEWDEGPQRVLINQAWSEHRDAHALLEQARAQTRKHLLDSGVSTSWQSQLSLVNIPLEHLKEFTAQIRDARLEHDALPPSKSQTVDSTHLTSLWQDGMLIAIQANDTWLSNATRQSLSEELLTVLTPPTRETDQPPTPARDRLLGTLRRFNENA